MAWNLQDDPFVRDMTTFSCESRKIQERCLLEGRQNFNILAKLKYFKDEDKLCDLHIEVQNTKFSAHKTVLAAWSQKFASQIISQGDSTVQLLVHYDNVEAFSDFLEYIYSGFIIPTETNVIALLDLGKNFMVNSLLNFCEEFLKLNVNSGNYVSRYFTSLKYGLIGLEEIIVNFIESNISNIIEQPELLMLSPQDFKTFLTSGKLGHVKQEIKFSLIISWVGYNILERDKFLLFLFGHIMWSLSVDDLLIQISCTENIFTSNELCLFQLLQSLVSAIGHHLGPFMTAYPRLYSIYSHMLDELSCPKIFMMSGPQIEEIVSIPICAVTNPSTAKSKSDKKDAAVNTDVDSTYFQENQPVFPEFTSQNSVSDGKADGSEKIVCSEPSLDMSCDGTNSQSSVIENQPELETGDLTCISEADKDTLNDSANIKHRRKNKPRKISVTSDTKEKKGRGRPKKNSNTPEKKVKEMKLDMVVKKEVEDVTDAYNSDTDDNYQEDLQADSVKANLSDRVDSAENNKITQSEINIEQSDLLFEPKKVPRIKLSLKLKPNKSKQRKIRTKAVQKKKTLGPTPKQVLPYPCSYETCDYSTKTLDRLEKHIETVHNVNVKLDCKKCEFTTNLMRDLCLHMKMHYTKIPYICDEPGCCQKFLRMGLLVRHQMSHMNEKPYKCDLCTKSFATFNQMSCHKKLHEGRQFECDVCYKRFTTKGVMQQHRAIHFDNKPYLCDTCGFSTKHLSHLISHRKIHTGNVFKCTYENCTYSSPVRRYWREHMNAHLNIRNHTCQVCGKSFVVRGKLLRHERIHFKEKLYKCKQCDYQTSRTDRMKLHIESHGIKFKKKKYNLPQTEEEQQEAELDYHLLYERVQPSGVPDDGQNGGMTMVSLPDMKPMDAISLAANASMIVDNYSGVRVSLDPLGAVAAVTSLEEMQNSAFQHSYESIQTEGFEQHFE